MDGTITYYNKKCVHCGKEYKSTSRGQRFCSDECQKKHTVRVKAKRKASESDRDINKLVSRCYALTHSIADLFLEKPKDMKSVDYRLHHKNLNPFDLSPWNLVYLPHEEHEKIHSQLSRVNVIMLSKILLAKPEILAELNKAYREMFGDGQNHDEFINKQALELINEYKIQEFTGLDPQELFDNLSSLKVKFMTLGPKTFAKKVFHVKGKTELRDCFKRYGYEHTFDAWLEEAKANPKILKSQTWSR